MTTRERPADRGRRRIRAAVRHASDDFRQARQAAGLSQRRVAAAIGASHSKVGRFERGELGSPSTDFLASACAVVGLDLALRAYPAGDPPRDRAQQALLERFHRLLDSTLRWRTEVPLAIPGDLRAWDGEVRGHGWLAQVEAETRPTDGQELARRLGRKRRDGGRGHLILVIADTRANEGRSRRFASRSRISCHCPLGGSARRFAVARIPEAAESSCCDGDPIVTAIQW